ncbi:MAG TPA: ABC transporter ATP-binding protein [Acidobacteriaceae bacterium]|nr:ABC transporter ATP-binding protein [Acidobacteriaceae bacterium]
MARTAEGIDDAARPDDAPDSAVLPEQDAHTGTWTAAHRLLGFVAHVDPRGFWLTLLVSLAGSVAEGFGLALLLPLLAVAGMNFALGTTAGRFVAAAQRVLVTAHIPHGLWLPTVLAVFLATGAVRSLLRRTQSQLVYTTTTRAELALSRRVYAQVVHARWEFLVRQRTGRLTHVLTAELRRVDDAISYLLYAVNLVCLTALYLALALKLSAAMTLLVVGLGGGLLLMQRRSLGQTRRSGRDVAASVEAVYTATEEHLLNLKSVKAYNAEDRDARLFGELCEEVGRQVVASVRHQAGSAFGFEMGSLAALGAVIYLALGVMHVQSTTMLMLLAIFTRLMPQLSSLQTQAHLAAATLPAYDRVLEIERECAAHAEPRTTVADIATRLRLERELRMEAVWFAYGAAEGESPREFVLRGVDLKIEAGRITAVVGPSGTGKSTIADLTNGLLLPTRGRLVLDGKELGPEEVRRWRHMVGYVGQDTVLFHQSVRDNLLWAKEDATEEEMRAALRMASAEFVYELPGRLETMVGDRGILLSSGQRQRISLARALLRRPALLILDEATNALDVENESRVLDGLHEAIANAKPEGKAPLTVLMIAHRASAIRRADLVYELEGGRVARVGTWEELNAQP